MDATTVADVIGIGEDYHGDTVSWGWRMAIVKGLLDKGFRVDVLCENFDFYVGHAGEKEMEKDGYFVPNLLPYSDTGAWHRRMTREFMGLRRTNEVRFFGIDVQQLSHGFARESMRPPVRDILMRAEIRRRWDAAAAAKKKDGTLRNELQAVAIGRFAEKVKEAKARTTKVVYFAQNEHVALGCANARKNPGKYLTDGMWLTRLFPHLRYLSIATFSPLSWNTWTVDRKPVLRRKKMVSCNGAKDDRRTCIDMGPYTTRDFDLTVVQSRSEYPHNKRVLRRTRPRRN